MRRNRCSAGDTEHHVAKRSRKQCPELLLLPQDVLLIILELLGCNYYPVLYSTCKRFQAMITWGTWLPEKCMDDYFRHGFFRLACYAARKWSWNVKWKSLFRSIGIGEVVKVKKFYDRCLWERYRGNSTWMKVYAVASNQKKAPLHSLHRTESTKIRKASIRLLKQGLIDELDSLLNVLVNIYEERHVISGIASSLLLKAKKLGWASVCEWLWTCSPVNAFIDVAPIYYPGWIYLSMDYAYFLSYTRRLTPDFLSGVPWERHYTVSGFGNANQLLLQTLEPWLAKRRETGCVKTADELKNAIDGIQRALRNNDIDMVRHYHESLKSLSYPMNRLLLPEFIRQPTVPIASWMHENFPNHFEDSQNISEFLGVSVKLNEWLADNFACTKCSLRHYTASVSDLLSDNRIDAIVHWMACKWTAPLAEKVGAVWKVMMQKPRQFACACTKYGLDSKVFHEWTRLLLEDVDCMIKVKDPYMLKERVAAYIECFDLPVDFVLQLRQIVQQGMVRLKASHTRPEVSGLTMAFCECVGPR